MNTTVVAEANARVTDGGRFQFMRVLGQGGFGTVLLAKDLHNNSKLVAIKCVKTNARANPMFSFLGLGQGGDHHRQLQEAWQEAQMLIRLRHSNIIGFTKAYEFKSGEHQGIAIVTDYCAGGDLHVYLEGNRAARSTDAWRQQRLCWFRELSNGLNFIHSNGVSHRDLKPKNVLITTKKTLKIADVGLAKPLWDAQSGTLSQQGGVDQAFQLYMSSVAGTPLYMAPEVYDGHYNQQSDVYSLGLMFVVMAEIPNPLVPIAKWGTMSDMPLGLLQHEQRAVQPLNASQLLSINTATPGEVKLFNRMLVYDYRNRLKASNVVQELVTLGANSSPIQVEDSKPESSSCCTII